MKAGLIWPREEYTCQTRVIQFSKSAASSQKDLFAIQDNILSFCVKNCFDPISHPFRTPHVMALSKEV